MKTSAFPQELLGRSKKERLDYFKNYIIEHPILTNSLTKIMRIIEFAKEGQIVFVYGPTGVGKTTLFNLINKRMIEMYLDQMKQDRNLIPVISVQAAMPTIGNFSWADLFSDMLEKLNDTSKSIPFFAKDTNKLIKERKTFFETYGYTRPAKLRYVVEKSIEARKLKVVIIDEAQHLTVLGSSRKLLDQPNTIKSIAERTSTIHILFGTYDLILLNDLNGQLSRRTEDIHFCRYDYAEKKDVEIFKNIIRTFQEQIPVKPSPNLINFWEYLYEHSIGCVGILKEWLDRAFKLMLDEDDKELTIEYLEATALSDSKCITIANEIISSEEKLSETFEGEGSLKSLLLRDKQSKELAEPESARSLKKRNARKINVGERKPSRDPIGGKK